MDFLDELAWRGMLYDSTDGLREALAAGPITGYIGFDPTADSLHVGSLLPLMALARLQRAGHIPIAIAGGGTGLIGDPKPTQERPLLSREEIQKNVAGIRSQLARFLDFDRRENPARIVDNAEWLAAFDLIGFLRDTGKHFTINYLLQKEAIARRLEGEEGISFTEFSYPLLQARDYLELFDRYHCTLQMGGSDQWGNITAGIDLVRKMRGAKVHALVMPLITTASGVKFGKTEAGAVWLDAARTSPYRFYQFWLNTDDRDVVKYLKFFTFMTSDEIDALAADAQAAPERRTAQRALARAVTALVHGDEPVRRAERAAQVLFSENLAGAPLEDILTVFEDSPSTEIALPPDGLTLADLLAAVKLAGSKGDAARLVKGGGIYVNNVRATDERARLTAADTVGGRLFILRKGRRDYHLVRVRQS